MNNPHRFKRAFTLIELLVVIAILAVLAALLLPALTVAKNRAKASQCSNSERQVGTGWAAYLNDHNGYYPYQNPECPFGITNGDLGTIWDQESGSLWRPNYAGGSCSWGNWQVVLAPYLNGTIVNNTYPEAFQKLMRCRSNPWRLPINDPDAAYGGNMFSYVLNVTLIPMTWRCGGASSCGSKPNNPRGWTKRTNMADIKHASTAALMLENPVCPGSNSRLAGGGMLVENPWTIPNGVGSWISYQPMPFPSGVGYGVNAGSVTNITGWVDPRVPAMYTWVMPDCNYAVSAFHNLGMNVLFFDGHVARVSKADLCSYTVDVEVGHYWVATPNPNGSPGGLFWTDGVGINTVDSNDNEYNIFGQDQFPGYQTQP